MTTPTSTTGFDWNAVSAIGSAVAACAAAWAAWLSREQVTAAREAAEISADTAQNQMFDSIFQVIQRQEQEFYINSTPNPSAKELRDRMFFNTVNYLAFLLESKVIQKQEFVDYFREAFLHWWTIFEREVPEEDRKDPTMYPEFKRIVDNIKVPPPTIETLN